MLSGKAAVVTGGTRGIGRAVVETFLENGAAVVFFGSRKETVDTALASLKERFYDVKMEGMYPDLTDEKAVQQAMQDIRERYGHIDILVNNAGMSDSHSFYEYDQKLFDHVMDLNVKAAYLCTQAVSSIMKEQGGGVILNMSSMVSLYAQARGVAYPMSKFAINGMTKALARELGPDHIRVNAVAPGVTNTDMVKALPKAMIEPLIQSIPLRRVGEPQDIANACLFLASDLASYITGAILSVDGAAMC